jgi:IS30 family transposase
MREAGMSLRQIAQRVGHHHSTVSRIVNKHRLTNDVMDRSSTMPNSIDDAFVTIANGNLCVLVLVNISLQVFWNDN